MSNPITPESYPNEYDSPPVYGKVPSIFAIEKMQKGLSLADALADEIPAAIRATMRS